MITSNSNPNGLRRYWQKGDYNDGLQIFEQSPKVTNRYYTLEPEEYSIFCGYSTECGSKSAESLSQ